MNCNKKSHFDGVTPVRRQEAAEVGEDLDMVCLRGGGALTGLRERDGEEGSEDEISRGAGLRGQSGRGEDASER